MTLADAILSNLIIIRAGAFSVSQAGTLVYWPLTRSDGSRFVWSTRQGQQPQSNVLMLGTPAARADGRD